MSGESIIKDLPEDFVRKMRNWARGNCGAVSYAMTTAYDGMGPSSGYAEASIPVLGGEAADVDQALAAVPNRYRQAVMLFWQYEGRPLTWLGRRLHVDYRAAERRVRQGHHLLIAELARRSKHYHRYHQAAADAGAY